MIFTTNAKKKAVGKCAGGKENGGCGFWADYGKEEGEAKADTKTQTPAQAKPEEGGNTVDHTPAAEPKRGGWLSRALAEL
jgi:hypothetical protein